MKKTLLSLLASALLSTAAFAQGFTQTATGFSYDCEFDTSKVTPKEFMWAAWTPGNGGGGTSDALENEIRMQWGLDGVNKMYVIYELGNTVDLSANPIVSVKLRSTTSTNVALPLTYRVHLEAGRGDQSIKLTESIVANVTGTQTQFNFDFTSLVKSGVDLKAVTKVIFLYDAVIDGAQATPVAIYFSEFKAGSFATVGIEDELLSRISESAVYPNPASSQVNVKLSLNTTSNVKVVLKDAQGNTVKTLTEQSTNAIDQAYNVSDLSSGLYFISYQIDGAAVKTQKLVIN